jgi:nucleotide-binding universal stress UspA family protein
MGERITHIACCVDGSPASNLALERAIRLRDQLGAERLDIVYIVPPAVYFGIYYPPQATDPPETPEWLTEMGTRTPHSNVVMIDSFANYPPAAASRWAEDEQVDLIVAASHQGAFRRMAVGSFAGYLAYHANCPVMLIPPEMQSEPN